MTNWAGHDVLYIGDHIYGDLAVCIEICFVPVYKLEFIHSRIFSLNMVGELELFSKKSKYVNYVTIEQNNYLFNRMKSI